VPPQVEATCGTPSQNGDGLSLKSLDEEPSDDEAANVFLNERKSKLPCQTEDSCPAFEAKKRVPVTLLETRLVSRFTV
jgi:hypothetical protein